MWPFKKEPPIVEPPPPPAPCGEDQTHAHWKAQGWACPACSALTKIKEKDREREKLAELIATKVVQKLKEQG